MANKKIGEKDIQNISAVISQMGMHSDHLAANFQKAISSGQKLNKEMRELAKKGIENLNKSTVALTKEQEKYIKNVNNLSDIDIKRLHIIQNQIRANNEATTSLRALTAATGGLSAAISALEAGVTFGLSIAFQALMATVGAFITLFNTWNESMRTVTQSMGQLAMSTGATGRQLSEIRDITMSMSQEFANLGGSVLGVEESAEFFGDLIPALRDTRRLSGELANEMLVMTRAFGMSSEQAVGLYRLLDSGSMGSRESVTDFTAEMAAFGESIGMTTGQVIQDFSDSGDFIARFGRDAGDVFRDSAEMAQQFGFQTRQIFEAAQGFNTFQQASQNVNELNAVLGTSLSSFELISERNPAERVEMIRQAIIGTGMAWSDMNDIQTRTIAQTLNMSEQDAARLFRDHVTLEQLRDEQEAAAAEQQRRETARQTAEEQMQEMLAATSTLWRDINRVIEEATVMLAADFGPIFREMQGVAMELVGDFSQWLHQLNQTGRGRELIHEIANGIRIAGHWLVDTVIPGLETVETRAAQISLIFHEIDSVIHTTFSTLLLIPGALNDILHMRMPGSEGSTMGLLLSDITEHGLASESLMGERSRVDAMEQRDAVRQHLGGVSPTTFIESQLASGIPPALVETNMRAMLASLGPSGIQTVEENGIPLSRQIQRATERQQTETPAPLEEETSAAETAPRTARTATSATRTSSPTVVHTVISPTTVTLDSRTVGQILWDASAQGA